MHLEGFEPIPFRVVAGRGAASGRHEYAELGGSIKAQRPYFLERGLDLSTVHNATINADISPRRFIMTAPHLTLTGIKWHPNMPAEDFSFARAIVGFSQRLIPALIYYPRPETKAAYTVMPPDTMLEILAPYIDGIAYGTEAELYVSTKEIRIEL